MHIRINTAFRYSIVRYLFAIAMVASAFAFRIWLIPVTGTGAPFVLFFATVMVISLVAGIGPGICALLISLPLAAYAFVTRAGYPDSQAAFQALLFAIDGIVVIYLTFLMKKGRQAARDANRQLRSANEEITRSIARTREIIELSPDAFFQADLDARFTDLNEAACRLLGYERAELIGKTIFDIIPGEDAARLRAVRADLLVPGQVSRAEWTQRRKDGTFVPVEVSSNILPDGRWQAFVRDITERKRSEEAVQRSEREFRELAESMPQIVWATRADGSNIYFNHQWVDYTGLTLEESHGEGWITPFHPDDRQRAWDAWQHATQHRDAYSLECRLRRADGVYQWWLIRGVPLLGENGEIRKWFGTCTDIEQIKIAEQRLKESEAKFSGIISISADAIISIDGAQRITLFNHGAEQIFGYSKSEAIGTPLDNLIPDRFRTAHRQHVERFAAGAVTARQVGDRLITIAGLRKNGEEFPAEAAISKLQVGDKTILTVALRDITERKRLAKEQQFLVEAGAALATSLDYEQTLATVAHLVVRDFADWCIVDVIDEREQVRRLKVVGGDPSKADLCARLEHMPLDRDRPYLLRAVFDTKQSLLIEHFTSEQLESVAQGPEHLQALRALNPTSLMAFPLMSHGQLLGALAFISSTGSRGYGRSDLRLAELLAERAAVAIENARLYRASVNATELRDQVLGVVAHDLRNPLSAILLQAKLLKRYGPLSERRSQQSSEAIHRAATRMNRLIQDLLDVALMESGQLSVERARLSARELVIRAVDVQRPLAASSSLEIRVDLDPEVPEVWGDQDRLLQVFENLIGNAIKFTEAGGSITVGAASSDQEIVFRVADTGCGIASEDLTRVFDRFWQATKAGRQGAGLGLPITKGIVEAHGGRIWVESIVGRGSTFFFTIPRVSAAQAGLSDRRRPDRVA